VSHETIRVDLQDRILTVTLHRPDRLNAFMETLDRADADDEVRALIFTGEGRGFCAGADLGGGGATFDASAGGEEAGIPQDGGGRLTLRLFDLRKPVIAAINGPAVGVGATMTLPMDVRLASEKARFGFVFARRGIVPEAASSWFLPRAVGINQAMEWVATGRVFPAAEALAGGLVSRVLPHEELIPAARALAAEIADNTSGVSVCLARQMMWKMLGADHPMAAHRLDSRLIHAMGRSPDAYEGVQSFLDKRPAEFTMSPFRDVPEPFPWWAERSYEE
jgi:enoyl-CoA hydratase/carnithine racemase